MPRSCSSRLQPRSHHVYRRRKVTINLQRDESSSVHHKTSNTIIYPGSRNFVPFVDNRLYFDPSSVLQIASTNSVLMDSQNFEYSIRSSGAKSHHHHHYHPHRHHHHHHHHHDHNHGHNHYHYRHNHHRKHRRVVSDPGMRNWNANKGEEEVKRHRRMFSYDTGITGLRLMGEESITEVDKDVSSPDETRTSTFRKVPWHPNLHMLKIRRI